MMVLPVTGPENWSGTASFADVFKSKYRQAFPIDRPLPYTFRHTYGKMVGTSFDGITKVTSYYETKSATFNLTSQPEYNRYRSDAYNMAYERLKSKMTDKAGWAENLAQFDKSRRLVVDRCLQLGSFAAAVRKGKFSDASSILRTPTPRRVSNRKAASQNFLEYEYGVKPLISDIQSSAAILSRPEFSGFLRAKGFNALEGSSGSYTAGPGYETIQQTRWSGTIEITLRTKYVVTNPDVFLWQSLGLFDLALPWKLVPFSFIVDWFVNFEQVLSSATDWVGVQLQSPSYTTFSRGTQLSTSRGWSKNPPPNPNSTGSEIATYMSTEMVRSLGFPSPSLTVKPFRGFSLERGAQAIALVLAVLGK